MRRIVTKDKKGKKKLVNVPSWDEIYVNNQLGQPAYDVSISSNGSGSAEVTPSPSVDTIRQQITASLAAYTAAAADSWVKVTKTEYDKVVTNVASVSKIGNNDVQINNRDVATSYPNAHITFGSSGIPTFSISAGQYVVGYISEAWNSVGTSQLGYTTSFLGTPVTNIGGAMPTVGGVRDYYIRKTPTSAATETRYPTLFMTVSPNAVNGTNGYNSINGGSTWNVNVPNATAKIQILVTSTKSWP